VSRLRTVLRLRELRERQALGALGRARQELAAAEDVVAARAADYADRPAPADGVGLSPAALWSLSRQASGALDRLAEAGALREQATASVDARLAAWSAASVAHASAQRLDERQRLAEAAAAQKRADNALDELVVLGRGRS